MKPLSLSGTRRALEPALRRLLHVYWRFARAMTLGARALVVDADGRIFLVKHSYVSGWHLPGGGVEAGETLIQAIARELGEEGNIEMTAPPRLHGIFFNNRAPGAITSRSSSCARSARRRRRSPMARLSRTASLPPMRCPTTPPPRHARASSRCSAGRR